MIDGFEHLFGSTSGDEPEELLNGAHLAQIAAVADGELTVSAERTYAASLLWWKGYDLYAYAALLHGEAAVEGRRQARQRLSGAVLLDPGQADGYAALIAINNLDGNDELRLPLLQALALTAPRFGEEQASARRKLPLWYAPLFTPTPVSSPDDVRLVYATALAVASEMPSAGMAWAEHCSPTNPRACAVQAFLATMLEEWSDAIDLLTPIEDDPELGRDASFLCGVAWEAFGFDEPASSHFRRALTRRSGDAVYLDVRYALANLHERLGEDDKAVALLSEIYAQQPGYRDVATRLGFNNSIGEIALPDDAEWREFLDSL